MGDMTIRGIDEETLARLRSEAEQRGVTIEELAAEILRLGTAIASPDRTAVPRAILASQHTLSPISSVELLRQLRDESS
jgi:plasmid stability protein